MNDKPNPFTIIFGVEPLSYIPRINDYSQIISSFESDHPRTFAYVITGVRGCGKTVLLSSVQNYFANKKNWIVLRLNPDIDLFESTISQLSEYISIPKEILSEVNITLAGFGGGFTKRSLSNNDNLLRKLLIKAKKENKKVLIAIDEASNSNNLKVFAHSYQAYIGERLPVYLLMTALPENFYSLSNSKNGTFLQRMPKIVLYGLNDQMIRNAYMEIFNVSEYDAAVLARYVKGYSFAFQVLGDLLWGSGKPIITDKISRDFDAILSDCVYTPIWNHLSENERMILAAIESNKDNTVKRIRESLNMRSNGFSPYRERLARAGLIDTQTHGKISFTLPRFDEFIKVMCSEDIFD